MTNRRLTREQRGWCVYDWANSVFQTSVLTIFLSLHLTEVVTADARASGQACVTALRECEVSFLGARVQAGSVLGFLLAASTILQLLVLPITGAIADRARNKRALLGGFAFTGAAATCGLAQIHGTSWELGAALFALANLCYYASIVVYYAFLPEIAEPDQRDNVSAKGWAFGYLGGGLCLALNIVIIQAREPLGLSEADAIRVAFVVCGVWWAVFTVIPLRRLTEHRAPLGPERGGALLTAGFRQLGRTLAAARRFPITLAFLAAFLVFIDGINTVAETAGLYGSQELKLPIEVLTITILIVQFVAFGGGLAHGRLAARIGAKRTILVSLTVWVAVISAAYFVQAGERLQFYGLALGIGLVLGGTAAMSRSLYSQLVPVGQEAQYFALYTLGERGTSWLGPLVFSLVANATGSFRPAILSLITFLAVGFALVAAVPVRRGIRAAGNPEPDLV
ncbi:MFS transporter [Pseudonocardia acaciae]|uniref:MFS transporter n=1 Tax=Pseudonocardia acaciae TaxID=551276 RepID=UPI001FE0BB70|nr:MFS transporter [Pseudonocardia acaciae]